jgi:hypothetical protein
MLLQTTNGDFRKDYMDIFGGLKTKSGGFIYQDQNQGFATWLDLKW